MKNLILNQNHSYKIGQIGIFYTFLNTKQFKIVQNLNFKNAYKNKLCLRILNIFTNLYKQWWGMPILYYIFKIFDQAKTFLSTFIENDIINIWNKCHVPIRLYGYPLFSYNKISKIVWRILVILWTNREYSKYVEIWTSNNHKKFILFFSTKCFL